MLFRHIKLCRSTLGTTLKLTNTFSTPRNFYSISAIFLYHTQNAFAKMATTKMSSHKGMEGKSVVLNAHMLDLPLELVHLITQYLSTGDLKNLTLVNHGYQRMARPKLFEAVLIDYSIKSSYFLQTLCYDASDQSHPSSASSIRSSIRHLTVATNPAWMARRHNITMFDLGCREMPSNQFIAANYRRPEQWRRIKYAKIAYSDLHLTSIDMVISSKLPNLQLLDWQDGTVTPRSLLTTIACSPIEHLRLFRVAFDEEFEVELPRSLERTAWPLRTLHLEPTWESRWTNGGTTDKPPGSLCRMVGSIIRLCAPSLETLKWVGSLSMYRDRYSLACKGQELSFPELRRLTIVRGINLADSSLLESMLGQKTKVRELEMDTEYSSNEKDFFGKRGSIRTLRTLCCLSMDCFSFLQANPHLHKLRIDRAMKASVLEHEILPLLAQSFDQLSSLSLEWEEAYISKNALEQIGTLQSLWQLHLSVGGSSTRHRNVWGVDHDEIRSCLRTLKNLHYLALNRDPYGDPGEYPGYYESKRIVLQSLSESAIWTDVMELPRSAFIKPNNPFSSEDDYSSNEDDHSSNEDEYYPYGSDIIRARTAMAFDKIHKLRMTDEAIRYARAFPKLQWIYIGKLQFAIKEKNGVRQAFSLTEERDDCYRLLRQMFGLPNSGDCPDFEILPP